MKQPMRSRVERFIVLPFAIGCTSESSVAVGSGTSSCQQLSRRPKLESRPYDAEPASRTPGGENGPKNTFFNGVHKLIAGSFKSFSQIFVVYRDEEMDGEVEIEMEIGFPTDVKHVTHIGLDGSTMTNPVKGHWMDPNYNLLAMTTMVPSTAVTGHHRRDVHDILAAFPSPASGAGATTSSLSSMRQFELAMAAQASVNNGSSSYY